MGVGRGEENLASGFWYLTVFVQSNELQRLALNKTRKQTKGGSRPCEHCALCGCYGKNNKSMVPTVSQLLTKTKTFKLNQSLTCADFGIYVATCAICHEQYVGQTSNKFSKRWSAHRSNWNKQDCKTDSDKNQMALSRHYKQATSARSMHRYFCQTTKLPLSLDICQNKWYHLIDVQINVQSMILPHVKKLLRCFVLFDSFRCCLPLCALAFLLTQLAYSHRSV